ncbi:hypothetical protein, partial [Nocardioides sp. ChNu-99]|uniref:hypothetical protein n=1 Tax=Nocardioides sp. ChNu-99 TaxID=2839897 RepID=UPI002405C70A
VAQRPGPCRLEVLREDRLARMVERETRGATLVGVNPGFDVHVLDKMLRRHRLAPAWHYWPIDVKSMAVGALHARGLDDLPDSSDALAELCGVTPLPPALRHTAMGDATWARDWYDRIGDPDVVVSRARQYGKSPAPIADAVREGVAAGLAASPASLARRS